MSFHYNIHEKKKKFPDGATVFVEFAHFPRVCMDFLQVL